MTRQNKLSHHKEVMSQHTCNCTAQKHITITNMFIKIADPQEQTIMAAENHESLFMLLWSPTSSQFAMSREILPSNLPR
jgi:hypothetical protein